MQKYKGSLFVNMLYYKQNLINVVLIQNLRNKLHLFNTAPES